MAHQRSSLVAVAAVDVHLTAAGLLSGKHHGVAEPLEHDDGRPPTSGNIASPRQVANSATRMSLQGLVGRRR